MSQIHICHVLHNKNVMYFACHLSWIYISTVHGYCLDCPECYIFPIKKYGCDISVLIKHLFSKVKNEFAASTVKNWFLNLTINTKIELKNVIKIKSSFISPFLQPDLNQTMRFHSTWNVLLIWKESSVLRTVSTLLAPRFRIIIKVDHSQELSASL